MNDHKDITNAMELQAIAEKQDMPAHWFNAACAWAILLSDTQNHEDADRYRAASNYCTARGSQSHNKWIGK